MTQSVAGAAVPAPSPAATESIGLEQIRAERRDVVLLDLRLLDQSGLAIYEAIRAIDARIPVIFLTSATSANAAIEAMKQGAFNYRNTSLDLQQLRDVVGEALDVAARMRMPVVFTGTADNGARGAFIGGTPAAAPAPGLDLDSLISRRLAECTTDLYAEVHAEVDRVLLTRALAHTKGNHRQAAQILGVARQTMRGKLRALGIHVSRVVTAEDDEDCD